MLSPLAVSVAQETQTHHLERARINALKWTREEIAQHEEILWAIKDFHPELTHEQRQYAAYCVVERIPLFIGGEISVDSPPLPVADWP